MNEPIRTADLEAYLDESLPSERMARIEQALRDEPALLHELAAIHSRRDSGVHTIGELWREHRLTCFTRDELGAFLLNTLEDERADFVRFHLETVGCPFCRANLADLDQRRAESARAADARRRRYFESSVGRLPRKR